MRTCPFCQGELQHVGGHDTPGRERAGNAREHDEFRCTGCSRDLAHDVSERFSGNEEVWSVRDGDTWRPLPPSQWPR